MVKGQVILQILEKCNFSKNRQLPYVAVKSRLVSSISLIAAVVLVLAILGALPASAMAKVKFNGNKCYLSHNPESVCVNKQGFLEWAAPGEQQQIVIRFPEMRLSEVGDIAEVGYLLKVDGTERPLAKSSGQHPANKQCGVSQAYNFLIGLFDSNGKKHVEDDGYGQENEIWKGYMGYYAQVFPHLAADSKYLTEDGKVQLPGKVFKRAEPNSTTLFETDSVCSIVPGISGFGAAENRFVPLFIKLKRTGASTVHFSVTIDNINYLRIVEDASNQPQKIDTFSIYFPDQWLHTKLTLAPITAAKSVLEPPLRPTSIKHVDVYREPGRFGGWPAGYSANQWVWGNEIMVAFLRGYYKSNPTSHTVDWSKPSKRSQARSLDGGETWTLEETIETPSKQGWPDPNNGGINFSHPDFAMRVGGRFFISYDRGRKWQGSYKFRGLDLKMTSRHDYMVQGRKDCFYFLSASLPEVNGSNHNDRAFLARTSDGGQSFEFVSWLTDEKSIKVRSVMPSAVRTSASSLVAATRRKIKNPYTRKNFNWIEASVSKNNGASWSYLSKVADTDRGEENGSPPALVRLDDGRLVVAYGYRSYPLGIRAKISSDGGETWSDEIVLRDDGGTWDLGYPRMMQRPDGKLVTIYYYNTRDNPAPHIVATIWDPDTVKR